MIYIDTSVALAHILDESPAPPRGFWGESLISSRLLCYEIWTRLHAYGRAQSHGDSAREIILAVLVIELTPEVLARALEPFAIPVRTLDALHLASVDYLRDHGQVVELATYDARLAAAAEAMAVPVIAP